MDLFIKASSITLIVLILWLLLTKQNKEISLVVSILSCCLIVIASIPYFEPVVEFYHYVGSIGDLEDNMIQILLRAVGVGILSEVICTLCADAGNAAIGKTLQLMASAVILWLSIPLLQELMNFIVEILGEL